MGQVLRRENIAEFVRNLQKIGKTVVATNGCFDILHVGHVRYLQKTKSLFRRFNSYQKKSEKKGLYGDMIRFSLVSSIRWNIIASILKC